MTLAIRQFVIILAAAAPVHPATHPLPESEARQWIAAAKGQTTDDGSTILRTLETAQRLRPDKFKFGAFEIGYSYADGAPDAVTVETWIGSKRLPADVTKIMLPIAHPHGTLAVVIPRASGPFLSGLQKGGEALVHAVDQEYDDVCVDAETRAKIC